MSGRVLVLVRYGAETEAHRVWCADRAEAREVARCHIARPGTVALLVAHDGEIIGAWKRETGWARRNAPAPVQAPPHAITVPVVVAEDVTAWSLARLSEWAHALPIVLIAALQPGADLTGYPRSKGPHGAQDLARYGSWWASLEAGASRDLWLSLAEWGEAVLYPEYRARQGRVHACEQRLQWLLTSAQLTSHLPPTHRQEIA